MAIMVPKSGAKISIDGKMVKLNDIYLSKTRNIDLYYNYLPYNFKNGDAVVLNGEIHILGSTGAAADKRKHYKWNGPNNDTWESVSTLPFDWNQYCQAIAVGNEIYLFDWTTPNNTQCYKFDGNAWSQVSTLPFNNQDVRPTIVVIDNEIHALGVYDSTLKVNWHYKFDGNAWSQLETLRLFKSFGSAIVLNNNIYLVGASIDSSNWRYLYKWDGPTTYTWTKLGSVNNDRGIVLAQNNKIIELYNSRTHSVWDGKSWSNVYKILPYWNSFMSVIVLDNKIHFLGGDGEVERVHCVIDVENYVIGVKKHS